jgi:hypothetical protein
MVYKFEIGIPGNEEKCLVRLRENSDFRRIW